MLRTHVMIAVIVLASATVACGVPCQDARCSIRPSEATRRRTAQASGTSTTPAQPAAEPAVAATAAPVVAAPAADEPPRISEAVDIIAQFEVLPPPDQRVNIVRLVAPDIDAPCKIEVDPEHKDGVGYVARNLTKKTMRIHQYRLHRATNGDLTAHPSVNQFRAGAGMPIVFAAGDYRAIITCVDLEGWGDPAKLEYTPAGKRVNSMLEALGARFAREGIVEAF